MTFLTRSCRGCAVRWFGEVLDLLGIVALIGFALMVWPPAALLIVSGTCLFLSWRSSR